jgi:methionine synthase I (cobalamin-dependent)
VHGKELHRGVPSNLGIERREVGVEPVNEKISFIERLSMGRPVLMDGAVNTELSRKGLLFKSNEWLRINLECPEILAQIHRDYARAGAELHIANSFSTARHVLEAAGLGEQYEALNLAAVQLCRDAIDAAAPHQQWIAGSLSTYAPDCDRNNLPSFEVLQKNTAEQSALLADAGCDILALEMLGDVDVSIAMLRGAARAALPISIGLVCTIMHSEPEHVGPALEAVRQVWSGDVGVYPNSGRGAGPAGWDTSDDCSPEELVQAFLLWMERELSIVGGCCGVGPEHVGALSTQLQNPGSL